MGSDAQAEKRVRFARGIPQLLEQAGTFCEQGTCCLDVSLTQANHSQHEARVGHQTLVSHLARNGQGLLFLSGSSCEVPFGEGQRSRTIERLASCSAAIEAIAVCQQRLQPGSSLVERTAQSPVKVERP